MDNLLFFDKEGHSLNFNYNSALGRYEGDLIFHQNSNDTFKSQSLYLFERVKAFEFENRNDLTIRKWQLFNEFGIHFYNSDYLTQSVSKIEPINLDSNYYSKWIYGDNFHKKFPLGTVIRFNESLFEFNNTNQTFVVVSTKKGAILIISFVDNNTFNTSYDWVNLTSYIDKTISSVDIIGIYNYINPSTFQENLSSWNEMDFYDRIYENRKLNIVNSKFNDNYNLTNKYEDVSIVTIKNENIIDINHYEYLVEDISNDVNLCIEVITKTDLPLIYQGGLIFYDNATSMVIGSYSYNNIVEFSIDIPHILKPGIQFKVPTSTLNSDFLTVGNILNFSGNVISFTYSQGYQVMWNNNIYQCIQDYFWTATSSIYPDDVLYWSTPTYLPIIESLSYESLLSCEMYLTTDHLYFNQVFTQSSAVTLASAANRFSQDLKTLNINLSYSSDIGLNADLIYPTKYAEVNFYGITNSFSPTSSSIIGSEYLIYERAIEVSEVLKKEYSYDYSENFSYNIVFSDLDDYGFIIVINKIDYHVEIEFIYTFGVIDMERTIDKTIRNWLSNNNILLLKLGIVCSLQTIGLVSSYYNSINIHTQYPNVPLDFKVKVGSTANFYIENSQVIFYEPSTQGITYSLGSYINIEVNNISYGITHSLPISYSNINQTLQNWVDLYADILDNYGIFVESSASSIKFNVKDQHQRCDIVVNPGYSTPPGDSNFKVIKKHKGNFGLLITSNEVLLGDSTFGTSSYQSFEEAGFATGMITGLNDTIYPLQNVEYNILYLNPSIINLSYEGPFWGLTNSICSSSPYAIVSFSSGFTSSSCVGLTGTGGMFDLYQFSDSFSLIDISTSTYSVSVYTGIDGMVDLVYFQPSNSVFIFGETSTDYDILILNSLDGSYVSNILLPSNSNSLKIIYNDVDNYVYALSRNYLWQIDPFSNSLLRSVSISDNAYSIDFNRSNGDVYVSTDVSVNIYSLGVLAASVPTTSYSGSYNLAFNDYENDVYVTTRDNSSVLRIDGSLRYVIASYSVVGLTDDKIVYDSVSESIYVWGSYSLYKILSGSVSEISSVVTGSFSNLLFNSLSSIINISTNYPEISSIVIPTDVYGFSHSYSNIWGIQSLNLFDGNIYLSNQDPTFPGIWTFDESGLIINNLILPIGNPTTEIIFNPDRNGVWSIQPSLNSIIEVVPVVNYVVSLGTSSYTGVTQSNFGSLSDSYNHRDYLWMHTSEYIRRPRMNFNGGPEVSFYYKWFSDNVPEFFLYDFSGNLLSTDNVLSYKGPKPLDNIVLNRKSNRDISKIYDSAYQQTIFPIVEYSLGYVDDVDDVSSVPSPIETFIGFNSQIEGGLKSILQLYKKESIDFTINTLSDKSDKIYFETVLDTDGSIYGLISLNVLSSSNFLKDGNDNNRGLKPGQNLAIFIKDETNNKNQYISNNNGYLVKISEVYFKTIKVKFFKSVDSFENESTIIENYPKVGNYTYLSVRFKVWDMEIGRFNIFGQTEVEDIRYKIELGNVGKLISSDDVYIFKEYDINEDGIDWNFLNSKRKEMLMMKNMIYPYIGSYKSIINAINYFGYNDLQLNEYYKNINALSPNYNKLFKVEIPDIFDNSVSGWDDKDFIKHTFPNENYEDTNLFNLTYKITDSDGNNVLTYTVDEVQKKLQGLKYWLQKNIIPITHKIIDITGRADISSLTTISHIVRDITIVKIHENFTPVSFKLNELYLLPVSNGSTVYNCVIDFYSYLSNISVNGSTYSLLPDYYNVNITTYEIYREWYAFKNYVVGDRVVYYDKLYESTIDNNETNNPRKYENISSWEVGVVYNVSDVIKYDRDFYIYSGYGVTSSTASVVSPYLDSDNWVNITEWKEVDMVPIQHISEYRRIDNLNPFNFTIDSNVDPYLVIEVTSDNGYGSIYKDKKNYEIKGILDLKELESFSNLTSKKYNDSIIPIVYPV